MNRVSEWKVSDDIQVAHNQIIRQHAKNHTHTHSTKLIFLRPVSEKIICSVTADIKKLKLKCDEKSFVPFWSGLRRERVANEASLLDIT